MEQAKNLVRGAAKTFDRETVLQKASSAVQDFLSSDQVQDLLELTSFARWALTQSFTYNAFPYHNGMPYSHGVWKQILSILTYLQTRKEANALEFDDMPNVVDISAFNVPVDAAQVCPFCSLSLKEAEHVVCCSEFHAYHTSCFKTAKREGIPLCTACLNPLLDIDITVDEDACSKVLLINTCKREMQQDQLPTNAALSVLFYMLASGVSPYIFKQGQDNDVYFKTFVENIVSKD